MDTKLAHHLKGYELKERIGTGGFGAVYKAFQSTVGREVAIKIILPGLANTPDFIRRFEAEAQLVARLEHPHITPLHDYWRDPEGAYLVMRLLRGGSVRDALQNGPFELRTAALLLDQIAGALSLAHRSGVIHRDIKPGNILLDEDGNAYLTDFGIAKDLNLSKGHTQPDAIIGSLDYISPEQARGEPVTPRTDIYSLGVTMYEIITGQHPFVNLSTVERLYKHINDPLPEITTLSPTVVADINAVIQKATTKNPANRYADALAFAADFREASGLHRTPTNVLELLTKREHEILHLMIRGLSNKEIAQDLTVTVNTVKWYINQIYSKLGVRSRVQAIVRARELNLIVPDGGTGVIQAAGIPAEDFHPENPYKGLRAFTAADAQDFFGREKVTAKLVKRLSENGAYGRFLAVVGPSGSGKSSLVKAGLIPALWRGDLPDSEKWFIVEMLPGGRPLDELEIALTKVAANQSGNLRDHLRRDVYGLGRAASLILPNDTSDLLLVVDQFEEVFTLVEDETERAHFLSLLYHAVTAPRSRVRVVITLRADFYDRPLHYPELGELVRTRLETIMPLTAEELEHAISKPAERVGVTYEQGLVSTIVADVNYQPGALPLLQYALTELFEQRQEHVLMREAYETIGKTTGALAKRAEEVYLDLDNTGKEAARQMFLRLVTLGEGTEDTRRRTARSELVAVMPDAELMDDLIDTYSSYRLLTLDTDPGTRSPTVELAHEAIVREWERLKAWLNESREDIYVQRQVSYLAAEWQAAGRDASFLARGSRLESFALWMAETQLSLTPRERAFVDASLKQRQAEQAAEAARQAREAALERRSILFLRVLVGVLALAALGAIGISLFAVDREQQAQAARATAQMDRDVARELALVNAARAALASDDPDTAIALALAANQIENPPAEAQRILAEAAYQPGTIHVFRGHTQSVESVAFSPDGRLALSGSGDGTLILWDVDHASPTFGANLHRFQASESSIADVSLSRDGHLALSSTLDKKLLLWDIDPSSSTFGEIIHEFAGNFEVMGWIALSPDGGTALTSGCPQWDVNTNSCVEDELLLWNTDRASPEFGQMLHRFVTDDVLFGSVIFSPDGRIALAATWDGDLIELDVIPNSPTFGTALHRLQGHSGQVFDVEISPDGSTALSAGNTDGLMIWWSLETYEEIRRIQTGFQYQGIAYHPNGHEALQVSADKTIKWWNLDTGEEITTLYGPAIQVFDAVFSPDGRYILSGGYDSELRLWDVNYGARLAHWPSHLNPYPTGLIRHVDLSPDGQRVLVAGEDHVDLRNMQAAALFDLETGEEIRRFEGYTLGIAFLSFAPDGRTGLISGWDGQLKLWDMDTGNLLHAFAGISAPVTSIAFSPDGHSALTIDRSCGVILWDVTPGSLSLGQIIRSYSLYEKDECGVNKLLAFSPDGRSALIGTNGGSVIYFDIETGATIRRLSGHTGAVVYTAFGPDGHTALTAQWETVLVVWDLETGQIIRRFVGQDGNIMGLALSSDGRIAVSDSYPAHYNIWDVTTGQIIRRYEMKGILPSISSDGKHIVGSLGAYIVWYRIDTQEELIAWTLANRYVRELTCEERQLYQITPLCDEMDSFPTRTPYPTPQPIAITTAQPIVQANATITPTISTATPAPIVSAGVIQDVVAVGEMDTWQYQGHAGEILTIQVAADVPCNWAIHTEDDPVSESTCLDTNLEIVTPGGAMLIWPIYPDPVNVDIEAGVYTDSRIEGQALPETGMYRILVSGFRLRTGGAYTLTLESLPSGTPTAPSVPGR